MRTRSAIGALVVSLAAGAVQAQSQVVPVVSRDASGNYLMDPAWNVYYGAFTVTASTATAGCGVGATLKSGFMVGKSLYVKVHLEYPAGDANHDAALNLKDNATGDLFKFGDTDYSGGFYFAGSGSFNVPQGMSFGSDPTLTEYEMTISDGVNVAVRRSNASGG